MRGKLVREPLDRLIAGLAATQHGLVSLTQLLELGLSHDQVQRRVKAGRLHRIHRGVYAVGHIRLTREGRLMAAVLACGDGAALRGRPAGAHWNLLRWSGAPEVGVPRGGGRSRRDGFVVHRVVLFSEEVTEHDAIRITTVARTLVDCAADLELDQLERAVAAAEKLQLFDLNAVRRVFDLHPRLPGRAAMNTVLGKWVDAKPELRSVLERAMYRLCRRYGLNKPATNVQILGYTVDFFWEEQKLIVETDGWEAHSSYPAFERDRTRDARLTAAGYRVVRFTYWQVMREPAYVAEVLRSMSSTR